MRSEGLKNNVFIVCDSLNPGGAERQTLLLTKQLSKNWNPILISISDGPLAEDYTEAGISVHIISRSMRYDIFSPLIKLKKLFNTYNPVLLHSWGWMATYASAITTTGTGIPFVSTVVRMGMVPRNAKRLHKLACKLGKASVANSHAGLIAWGIPQNKAYVVYNGFDLNRIYDHDNYSRLNKSFRIVMTASMSPLKDWEAFISAARHLSRIIGGQNIQFYGYGDGLNREQILSSAKDLLEKGSLFLPGRTFNPIQECKRADVGIMLSLYGEGISNSIMEYMACGLPVICSNSGGNPELVIDGVTGFLIDPDNPPEQIAEIIQWLKSNPDKGMAMGLAGKKRIETHFSTAKMVEAYEKIYSEVLRQ